MKQCKDTDKDDHLEKILEELRVDYVQALPAVIESLESFYSQGNFSLVREEFHKLKGTGKTYGLDEISILGETMERLCVEFGNDIEEYLPTAILLLEKIYASRNGNNRFFIEEDGDFASINNCVAVH